MTTMISKRRKAFANKVDRAKAYPALDAMKLVKETATAKFDESVDVAVNLGIDAKKSDQTVRGSVLLPAGTGKKVRVAVFAQGDKAQAAKAAGIESGSPRPHTDKVGKITKKQVEDIAKVKMPDLNAASLEAAMRTVAGSARSMGIIVEGM